MKKRMLSFLMIGLLVFQNFQIVYADDIEMSPNTEQQIEVTIKEDSSNEESVNEFEDESEAIGNVSSIKIDPDTGEYSGATDRNRNGAAFGLQSGE